ncbi:MAG TPA: class I SAM-dependent methyltransferase [Candidatus Saccharimonadales bacterium]|jgi:arsenite methyltransferase|nr:class I SAM-dependent methyltransferase [Candidatus Saccharimonadales bacterium]
MTGASTSSILRKPDYGLDAPVVQRTLLYGGFAAVVIGRVFAFWLKRHSQAEAWQLSVRNTLIWGGVALFLNGGIMFWGSRVGKLRLRDKILDSIKWRGDEQVLDVGCGHGLMLLSAAKRLTNGGYGIGVDIWSQVDQADNSAEATLENAKREGVAGQVELSNSDARDLPFADNSFDVILSSFAIHNISAADGREKAIREIARVLKPGGQLALADINNTAQYEKILRGLGWRDVNRWFPNFLFVTPTRVVRATKP